MRNGIDTDVWYPAEPDAGRVGAGRPRRRPRAGRSSRSSGGSPGRRASPICWRPRTNSTRRAVGAVRRSARHSGNRRRSDAPRWPSWPRSAPACSGSGRCCRSGRFAKYSRLQQFSYAHRCTSRWASSTWKRWPAHGGGGLRRRWHTRGGRRRGDRFAGALRRRRRGGLSEPDRPRRSTRWSPTRSGRSATAEAGRQRCIEEFSWAQHRRSRRWRSTGRCAHNAATPRAVGAAGFSW